MEGESYFELSLEDVLKLHRGWIEELYVEDRKTEVEIIALLYQRGFSVTWVSVFQCSFLTNRR